MTTSVEAFNPKETEEEFLSHFRRVDTYFDGVIKRAEGVGWVQECSVCKLQKLADETIFRAYGEFRGGLPRRRIDDVCLECDHKEREIEAEVRLICTQCKMKRTPGDFSQSQRRCKACRNATYKANAPAYHASKKAFRAEHPETVKAYTQRRRARRKNAPGGNATPDEIKTLFAKHGGRCAYCPSPATHADHVVPLSKGGSNDISNLLPACAPCNLSKGAKDLAVWFAARAA